MAGDWIKVENATPQKSEIWAIAETLNIDPDAVFGKLVRIWIWFDEHTEKGNAPSVTKKLLDRNVGVKSFCDCVINVGWMCEKSNKISLPNFDRHNGKTAKNRALTAKRVSKHKKKSNGKANGKGNGASVNSPLPKEEKRRVLKEGDKSPPENPKEFIWTEALKLHGVTRTLLGKLCKEYSEDDLVKSILLTKDHCPADPKSYLIGILKNQDGDPFQDAI